MRIVRRRDEAVRVIAWRAQLTTNPIFFKFPPPLTLSPPTTLTPRPYPNSPAATRSISTRSTACDCWSARCAAARDPTTARGPRPASTSATARRGPRPCCASCASARRRRRSLSTTRATSRGIPRWRGRSTSTRRTCSRARARPVEPRWWARSSRSCANPRRDPTRAARPTRRARRTRTPRSRVRSPPEPGPRRASYRPRAGPPRRRGAEPSPALARPRSRVPNRRTRSRWHPRSSNRSPEASSAPSRRRDPGVFRRSNPARGESSPRLRT